MSDPDRPTVKETDMIDCLVRMPSAGSRVWALQHGGSVVPTVVDSRFAQFFDAWYPYLKVPESVKKRQLERFPK